MTLSEVIGIDCICLPTGTVLRGDEALAFVDQHSDVKVLWSDSFNAYIDLDGKFHVKTQKPCHEIEFVEINEVRASRGTRAARFIVDGSWLWMSIEDIKANIEIVGNHPELLKGLEAYQSCSQMTLTTMASPMGHDHSSSVSF